MYFSRIIVVLPSHSFPEITVQQKIQTASVFLRFSLPLRFLRELSAYALKLFGFALPGSLLPCLRDSNYLVRKLICPREALTRANTKVPPTTPVRPATTRAPLGAELPRPAPCINQNIPRIAHTDISTARITDVRRISTPAAPAMKVSICSSQPCVPRQTNLHAARHLEIHRFTRDLNNSRGRRTWPTQHAVDKVTHVDRAE